MPKTKALHSESLWYAVMARPCSEFNAQHELRTRGYRTWLPFERVRQRRKIPTKNEHIIVWVRKPLFARYLFVRIDPGQNFYLVNESPFVSTVVYQGGEPMCVPIDIMDAWISRSDQAGCVGETDKTARKRIENGAKVYLDDSHPFAGFLATVTVDTGRAVRVLLNILGDTREVSVEPEALRLVE